MKTNTTPIITFDGTYKRVRLNPAAVKMIPNGTTIKLGKLQFDMPGVDLSLNMNKVMFGTTITDEPNGGQVFRNADLFNEVLNKESVAKVGEKTRFKIVDVCATPGDDSGDFIFMLQPLPKK